ncbi:Uncharacterised protein [Vibrio cholerae]|nr:Uncharacterised protein [Vibrio cholerae]
MNKLHQAHDSMPVLTLAALFRCADGHDLDAASEKSDRLDEQKRNSAPIAQPFWQSLAVEPMPTTRLARPLLQSTSLPFPAFFHALTLFSVALA